HVPAGDIDLVLQGDGHGHAREGFGQLPVVGDDGLDPALSPRGQRHDLVAAAKHARGDGTGEAAEVEVRAQDVLHREAQVGQVAVGGDVDRLQIAQERRTEIPGHGAALVDHVVAAKGRDGDELHVGDAQLGHEARVVALDALENILVVVDEVHLVDG